MLVFNFFWKYCYCSSHSLGKSLRTPGTWGLKREMCQSRISASLNAVWKKGKFMFCYPISHKQNRPTVCGSWSVLSPLGSPPYYIGRTPVAPILFQLIFSLPFVWLQLYTKSRSKYWNKTVSVPSGFNIFCAACLFILQMNLTGTISLGRP